MRLDRHFSGIVEQILKIYRTPYAKIPTCDWFCAEWITFYYSGAVLLLGRFITKSFYYFVYRTVDCIVPLFFK